jgi:cyclic-di-AMP phosphodiesterase PgpH
MLADTPGRRKRPAAPATMDRWSKARATVLGLFLAIFISIVLIIDFLPSNLVFLSAGYVSSMDILAPYDLTYESELRTRQAQDAQAASVEDIYDPPDPSVGRQQEVRTRQILDYISTVREDPYSSLKRKAGWIAAIPDLQLSSTVLTRTLELGEEQWKEVEEEAVQTLIGAMQGEIRDSQVAAVRRSLPTLISPSISVDQAAVVEAIAGNLVKANTSYNAARTEEAKQQARLSTEPVQVTIRKGEAIVRQGSLVRPVDIEALDAFGLRQQEIRWQSVAGAIALAIIATLLLELLIFRLQPSLWSRGRTAGVTVLLIALFVVVGKLMLPVADSIVPYLYPLPALSMILSILFGPALGMAVGVIMTLLGGYMSGGSLEITTYLLAGALMGALSLGRAERLKSFLRAGLSVALTNAAVLATFGILAPEQDLVQVTLDALVGIISGGLATSLALAAFFIISAGLDLTTPFQLMELSRPTHPLLRQLLLKAPGTYYHTLMVANMAEEAAERIGADGLLTRVGTYYHDIGKTVRPYFFAENRVINVNPHERLTPHTSAQIIISHVTDGLDLAQKYRLPSAIRAFIPEHHGTGMTLAFYRMAVKAAGDDGSPVDEASFRYPGPKPQSQETAITMLADSCEARVRSAEPATVEEMEGIVAETIKTRQDEGQLDDCDLTLRELSVIRDAFISVLRGVFHPRVKYPEPVKVKGPNGQEVVV